MQHTGRERSYLLLQLLLLLLLLELLVLLVLLLLQLPQPVGFGAPQWRRRGPPLQCLYPGGAPPPAAAAKRRSMQPSV